MGIRISELTRDERTIQVPVGKEQVNITYRPGGFTPETEDRLHQHEEDQRGGAALVELLEGCLVRWDLEGEDGQPMPIDGAVLRTLPIRFLAQAVKAIAEDMNPNAESAEISGAISSRKAR